MLLHWVLVESPFLKLRATHSHSIEVNHHNTNFVFIYLILHKEKKLNDCYGNKARNSQSLLEFICFSLFSRLPDYLHSPININTHFRVA